MTIEFFWQLPTSGDARYADARQLHRGEREHAGRSPYSPGVSDPRGDAFNFFDHLHQIARAADLSGFNGIQIRHDPAGDESWIVAGYIARSTRNLTLLTEFDASRGSAVYAAKNAVSYQRFSGGRFAWQITAGGNAQERRKQGDFVPTEDIYPRIEEFLTVSNGVQTQSPYSFKGRFFEVLEGGFKGPLAGNKVPPVYLSGDTEQAYRISAKHADVHVLDALPLDLIKPAAITLKGLAKENHRQLSLALRVDVLARETEEEAVFDARRFVEQRGGKFGEIAPKDGSRLWKGFSTSHTGASASLVGSYEQVAEALAAYADAGISTFILAAVPHFEETYRVGEHVLPLVKSLIRINPQPASVLLNKQEK